MLEGAQPPVPETKRLLGTRAVVLMEMTLENLLSEGQLNHADFLARVDILSALGRTFNLEVRRILSLGRLSLALHQSNDRLVMGVRA